MQRLTRDEYIRRSRAVHGNKYDYSRTVVASATAKVVIICPKHGPFEQAPSVHYSQGCGCPSCARNRRLTIEVMRQHAAQKGGACLSARYVNSRAPLRWRCSEGHTWTATPSNIIKTKGTWCPDCAGVAPRTLKQMIHIAKERGGVCLSTEYRRLHAKLKWRCKNGHEFAMSPGHVIHRNQWCPRCSRLVSERICRAMFEALFRRQFPKAKPDWLTTVKGNQAELDGCCAELRLAFERHGEQHYRRVGHFHRTTEAFRQRQEDDAHKLKLCAAHGLHVFVIPYTVSYGKLEAFVRSEAAKSGVPVRRKSPVKWKNLDGIYDPGHLGRMQGIARKHGGTCLSTAYVNNSTKLLWRCAERHEWKATPAHVAMGGWCPHCCGRNNPRTLEQMKTLAAERHGQCLSKIYRRNEFKLKWRCAEGHIWCAAPSGIIGGRWCPDCGGSKPKTIREMRRVATERGGKCLSSSYRNSVTKLQWRCKEGHVWLAQPGSVIAGSWCRKCKDAHSGDSQRLTLEDMHLTAAERGGRCLSTEYRNNGTKLHWQCSDGHEWTATPGHVRNGRWCPECKRLSSGASQRLSIDHAHRLAKRNGGSCLATAYRNANTPMDWECAVGHRWSSTYNKIQQGHWCRRCRTVERFQKKCEEM